ncbi:MAG: nucleoside-diphosphate sugar epimerase/dehydratase [Bacteroidales bacterium]
MIKIINKLKYLGYLDHRLVFVLDLIVSVISSTVVLGLVLAVFGSFRNITLVECAYYLLFAGVASTLVLLLTGLHKGVVRNSSLNNLFKVIVAVILKELLLLVMILCVFTYSYGLPHIFAIIICDLFVTLSFMIGYRVLGSILMRYVNNYAIKGTKLKNVIICGSQGMAPVLGNTIELNFSDKYRVMGFITSSKDRDGSIIDGKKVYYVENSEEAYDDFFEAMKHPTVIFPSYVKVDEFRDNIVKYCINKSISMMIAPNLENVNSSQDMMPKIREIEIEDLLDRTPIAVDVENIKNELGEKTIMITGAAGSIGSEIVRQIAALGNVRLLLVDNAETPMHTITLELNKKFPDAKFDIELADVRSTSRVRNIMNHYKPNVVYHAAAYKHVPLMEENPDEAILTNVLGTKKLAEFAVEYGVEKFVMVSTDKAVNPTNVMGASKRIAEMYVQSLNDSLVSGEIKGNTKFITTRFGNVLGSNGSVIPYFKEQIKNGGPVTVTHPDIIRFFMTIPEACRLVLQASVMGEGGEIFVFDMGEQVKIADMARRMIRLAGLVPDEDIKIEYTGLRPGEKLYEEVLSDKETTFKTSHQKIRGAFVRKVDYRIIDVEIEKLIDLAREMKTMDIVAQMKSIVPEFKSRNSQFEVLDKD